MIVILCAMLSRFSRVPLCNPMDCIACHAPVSLGFSRQEYWSGLSCLSPGDLPHPGIELAFLMSPALAGRFFTTHATWEAPWWLFHVSKYRSTLLFYSCIIFQWLYAVLYLTSGVLMDICIVPGLTYKDVLNETLNMYMDVYWALRKWNCRIKGYIYVTFW